MLLSSQPEREEIDMDINEVRLKTHIVLLIGVALFIGGCGSDDNVENDRLNTTSPVISDLEAKHIFAEIDDRLDFTVKSIEYLGVSDYLYYADLMGPDSQVTINIGKPKDDDASFTSLYVHVMALNPIEEELKQKLDGYAAKYIYGFLSEAFADGEKLVRKIDSGIQRVPNLFGKKSIMLDSGNYELNYELGEGDKNPSYFDYELKIAFKPHQKELIKRFSGYSP